MGLFDAVGSLLGTNKSGEAMNAQAEGASQAMAIQKAMYDQTRQDQAPWLKAGHDAIGKMQDPNFQKSFTMADFNADPGYAFRMSEGQKAIERSAAAKGGLNGGGTLKALTKYGQNVAADEYQSAYSRFNNDQNTRFGRLSTISGAGQTAGGVTAQASQNYGNSMSDIHVGLGNAKAAGYIGDANRNAQMFGDVVSGASSAIAFCDERLKKDIQEISKEEMQEMKSCLKAYRFKYKDEKHGKGDYIGVMTQDLKKSKLGKTLVVQDDEGNECVDLHRTLMLFLATMAEA